ncbi:MAG: OmpA family protein [Betaproteobacteria bacterium]|nr:OmpA family protein [Betaproteobacteria bacterium]
MKAALLLVAGGVFVAGCASAPQGPSPNESVIILPGKDGHVGGVSVVSNSGQHLLDKAWAGVEVLGGTARGRSFTQAEVHDQFASTLSALPPKPASFVLYFLEGKDEFTPASREEIARILNELKSRPAPDIVVIGHTDTVGGESSNDKLSLQRAERVRELLVKPLGLTPDRIQAAGRGKRELLIQTGDGVSEARNRRVEINVR